MSKLYSILFKLFILIIIIAVIGFGLSGSYASQSIDKLAYVVALAIDYGDNNNIKLTIQLANPNSFSSESSSSSSQSSASVLSSVECSSIESGINLLNSYISRNVNLSHCKAILISEAVASKDLSQYIYDLCNNVQVSSHATMIITKCNAIDFLKMSNPIIETFSARYYQVAPESSKYTGYTNAVPLIDFFNFMLDTSKQPVAALGDINTTATHSKNLNSDVLNKDSSYVAGESPITSSNQVESMGVAVFQNGKLVGELNGLESICHMIVSGELQSCNIQISDPKGHPADINVNLKLRGKPKYKLEFINGFAYIKIDVKLSVRILSIDSECDYSDSTIIKSLENEINSYIQKTILDYLYKTAKKYNSDIDGFGRFAVKYFKTTDEWKDYNWLENYKNSFFSVNVDSKLKSGYSYISIS